MVWAAGEVDGFGSRVLLNRNTSGPSVFAQGQHLQACTHRGVLMCQLRTAFLTYKGMLQCSLAWIKQTPSSLQNLLKRFAWVKAIKIRKYKRRKKAKENSICKNVITSERSKSLSIWLWILPKFRCNLFLYWYTLVKCPKHSADDFSLEGWSAGKALKFKKKRRGLVSGIWKGWKIKLLLLLPIAYVEKKAGRSFCFYSFLFVLFLAICFYILPGNFSQNLNFNFSFHRFPGSLWATMYNKRQKYARLPSLLCCRVGPWKSGVFLGWLHNALDSWKAALSPEPSLLGNSKDKWQIYHEMLYNHADK